MSDQGGAGGIRGHSGAERALGQGGADGLEDEVESGDLWLEAETGYPHAKVMLGTRRPEENQSAQMVLTEDELRGWQEPVEAGLRN